MLFRSINEKHRSIKAIKYKLMEKGFSQSDIQNAQEETLPMPRFKRSFNPLASVGAILSKLSTQTDVPKGTEEKNKQALQVGMRIAETIL